MDGSNSGSITQAVPPMMQACLWKRSPCGQRHIIKPEAENHNTRLIGPMLILRIF
jgi:hypothetical protein